VTSIVLARAKSALLPDAMIKKLKDRQELFLYFRPHNNRSPDRDRFVDMATDAAAGARNKAGRIQIFVPFRQVWNGSKLS